jgi:hypothetical protein
MGDALSLPVVFLHATVFGAIGGVISLHISGALIRWTGSWLGGQATFDEVRAAIAWASVPQIYLLVLWIPELLIFGEEMFTTATPRIDSSPLLAFLLLAFAGLEIVVGAWNIVVYRKCIGEAHQFSAWKGLASTILAGLIIAVPISCVVLLFAGLGAS